MTSTAGGDGGASFGWINRELIASSTLQPHMNVFGGEDRFWLGPEGGQFSIFFAKGAKFELADWQTPAADRHDAVRRRGPVRGIEWPFGAGFALTNYSGTRFDVQVRREVRLADARRPGTRWASLRARAVQLVAYESDNRITNAGARQAWQKETGLLSVWILGMFNPAPATTIVVPIKPGPEADLGAKVTSDYFGSVPPGAPGRAATRRRSSAPTAQFRSKIGVGPRRSRGVLGSYDADGRVLTIVQFTQPAGVTDYVNSLWKLQDEPYAGDAANSYNDGPPAPGAKPLGPFYELESSSPAAALAPGASLTHVHRTMHLTGTRDRPRCGRARGAWRVARGDQGRAEAVTRARAGACGSGLERRTRGLTRLRLAAADWRQRCAAESGARTRRRVVPRRAFVDGLHRRERVRLRRGLVVAVALHPGEPQGEPPGYRGLRCTSLNATSATISGRTCTT